MSTSKQAKIEQVKGMMDELQNWFARKPYGWRETATPGMIQQWDDRSREYDMLCDQLARLEG